MTDTQTEDNKLKMVDHSKVDDKGALVPTDFNGLWQYSTILAKSNMVPKHYQGNPENVLVAIQWGQSLGLHPMQALQNIAVINNTPSLWGDAVGAVCMNNPEFDGVTYDHNDDRTYCKCTVWRKYKSGQRLPIVGEYSVEDAKQAGLLGKDNWKKDPKRMVEWRASSRAYRKAFPDSLKGIPVKEELEDLEPVKTEPREVAATVKDDKKFEGFANELKTCDNINQLHNAYNRDVNSFDLSDQIKLEKVYMQRMHYLKEQTKILNDEPTQKEIDMTHKKEAEVEANTEVDKNFPIDDPKPLSDEEAIDDHFKNG